MGLTLVAGGVDALGYFRLGHVFVANMTGNLVLFAVAVSSGHASQASRSLWALLGFMVGAFLSSALGRRVRWWFVAIESLGLLLMGVLFWSALDRGRPTVLAAIFVGSFAMGVQSRLGRDIRLDGTTTTVVTITLTQIMDDIMSFLRGRTIHGWNVRVAVFLAYAVGAALAAFGRQRPLTVLAAASLAALILFAWTVRSGKDVHGTQ